MDTLAHGLIGALLCSRTGLPGGRRGAVDSRGRRLLADWTFWTALGFGLLPDLASLGIHFGLDLVMGNGIRWRGIPPFVFTLYNVTHSLLGMGVCIGLILWWKPKLLLPVMAWPVHVFMDVPTHGSGSFVTPLFWPFSKWGFAGWNWWEYRGIFYGTWIAIGAGWLLVAALRLAWKAETRRAP